MSKKFEYSKLIIIFETILITILTIGVLLLTGYAIHLQFVGALPYLTAMITAAWAAYGVSVAYYYNKAKLENKIKLLKKGADKDVVMAEPYIGEAKKKTYNNDIDSDFIIDNEVEELEIEGFFEDEEVLG